VVGRAAGPGAAVEEDGGLAIGIAAQLPIDAVAVADVEVAGAVGLYRRVEGAQPGQKLISS
jgi:hypothetical protein